MRLPLIDPDRPPPGPFRPGFWRSPLRSPQLTAMLGLVLLIGLPLVAVTGLLSNDAYQPGLGVNALGRDIHGPLDVYLFGWPSGLSWLYAFTQGLHVTLGLALFPVVLAKLWSVIPKLFEWPPVRSPAHALERLTLALLVGGALFEFVTGIMNIQYWYAFNFDFPQAHYYGAWVFIGALVTHIPLKLGTMRRSLRTRAEVMAVTEKTNVTVKLSDAGSALTDAGSGPTDAGSGQTAAGSGLTAAGSGQTAAGSGLTAGADGHSLLSPNPAPASMSRRALFTAVGGASTILLLQGIGQSVGGSLRGLAFLLPRGHTRPGPLGFQVNRTWVSINTPLAAVGDSWRLTIKGRRSVSLTRARLLAMPQHSHSLPIACVEGWSTTQTWTGVRVSDLAALAGVHGAATLTSISLDHGTYGTATLGHEEVSDPQTLLAVAVNGLTLPLDHGYPARIISPAIPGVHCTKWVVEMHFEELA